MSDRRSEWQSGVATFAWTVPHRIVHPAGSRASFLVVALHGMGEDEEQMADWIAPLAEVPATLLVPRAPFPYEERRRERIRIGHAWYAYDGDDARFVRSMDRVKDYLFPLIDREQRAEGAQPDRTVLLGFSQGAYLAYYLALRYPDRFGGVVGVAGRPKDEVLQPHLAAAGRVRVLHLHGDRDRVVAADACRESVTALARRGLDVTFRLLPGGHELTREMLDAVAGWLPRLSEG